VYSVAMSIEGVKVLAVNGNVMENVMSTIFPARAAFKL
jgi:hypothetical protein